MNLNSVGHTYVYVGTFTRQAKQCQPKTMWHTAVKNHSFVNKTERYRQHVCFINDKRSERFNDPIKATYKEL